MGLPIREHVVTVKTLAKQFQTVVEGPMAAAMKKLCVVNLVPGHEHYPSTRVPAFNAVDDNLPSSLYANTKVSSHVIRIPTMCVGLWKANRCSWYNILH
jgi:hypothetical protein